MKKATAQFRRERSAFSQRLERLRGARTTEEFAKLLGMARQQLERYENDRAAPTLAVLARIATRAKASLDWLILGVERDSHDGRSASTHTPDSVQGAERQMAREVIEAQQEVWRVYEAFGPESIQWKLVSQTLRTAAEDARSVKKAVSRRPAK